MSSPTIRINQIINPIHPSTKINKQAIIAEINRLEELELKLYKETIDAAELEKTIVVRAPTCCFGFALACARVGLWNAQRARPPWIDR